MRSLVISLFETECHISALTSDGMQRIRQTLDYCKGVLKAQGYVPLYLDQVNENHPQYRSERSSKTVPRLPRLKVILPLHGAAS